MLRLIALISAITLARGFNIATKGNPSPILSPDANRDASSSFFGYNIKLGYGSDDTLKFAVGSPKSGNSSIHLCPLPQNNGAPSQPCTPTNPPTTEAGKTGGLSLSVSDNLEMLACYPGKILLCLKNQLVPGFCYKSSNRGKRWNKLSPDEEKVCPAVSSRNLDLIFLLDGSSSVGAANFGTMKNWVLEISSNFDVESGAARIGVIQYSSYDVTRAPDDQPRFQTEIKIGQYNSRSELDAKIEDISHLQGFTYTARALNKSVEEFRASPRFTNPNTSKVLVLLTDGAATNHLPLNETARFVRSLGIQIISVGVGDANLRELRLIATGTKTDDFVYYVEDFKALDAIAGQLTNVIRNLGLEGSSTSDASPPPLSLQLGETGFSTILSKQMVSGLFLLRFSQRLPTLLAP